MPIQTHNFISNQLLGTSLANSAALSTLPLRKPFTLSPKRDRGKKFHLLQLRARSFIIAWVHRLHIKFFCFRKHLGSIHSLFIVVLSLASDCISSPLGYNARISEQICGLTMPGRCVEPQMHPGKSVCYPVVWAVADQHSIPQMSPLPWLVCRVRPRAAQCFSGVPQN